VWKWRPFFSSSSSTRWHHSSCCFVRKETLLRRLLLIPRDVVLYLSPEWVYSAITRAYLCFVTLELHPSTRHEKRNNNTFDSHRTNNSQVIDRIVRIRILPHDDGKKEQRWIYKRKEDRSYIDFGRLPFIFFWGVVSDGESLRQGSKKCDECERTSINQPRKKNKNKSLTDGKLLVFAWRDVMFGPGSSHFLPVQIAIEISAITDRQIR